MAKGVNQKRKLLYLADIFKVYTDENHGLTIQDIVDMLEQQGVSADRKTLYLDFEELRCAGYDIVRYQEGRRVYYALASRMFELPELKLLVDSVQSSKFITERKSRQLISKIESLVSMHDAKQLHRQVILSGRVKTMNESIYYSVDQIHSAINQDQQIQFHYFQWNQHKEMVLRHDGKAYQISPWALLWDDENYYMIGYDAEAQRIKHYRVDKMLHIRAVDVAREGKERFQQMELPHYAKSLFGMFGGEPLCVTLRCRHSLAGVMIDRFGKDIPMLILDDEYFQTHVNVSASRLFLGWIISLGSDVQITAPESLVQAMKEEARRLLVQYK